MERNRKKRNYAFEVYYINAKDLTKTKSNVVYRFSEERSKYSIKIP